MTKAYLAFLITAGGSGSGNGQMHCDVNHFFAFSFRPIIRFENLKQNNYLKGLPIKILVD